MEAKDLVGRYVVRTAPVLMSNGLEDSSFMITPIYVLEIDETVIWIKSNLKTGRHGIIKKKYDDGKWKISKQGECSHILSKLIRHPYCYKCGTKLK